MAAAVETAQFQGAMGIDKTPGVTHPTPGLLHQMTNTPWLIDKLRPRRIGTLLVYVRLPSGQLSSEHPGGYFQERVVFCGRSLDAPCYAQLLTCARPY